MVLTRQLFLVRSLGLALFGSFRGAHGSQTVLQVAAPRQAALVGRPHFDVVGLRLLGAIGLQVVHDLLLRRQLAEVEGREVRVAFVQLVHGRVEAERVAVLVELLADVGRHGLHGVLALLDLRPEVDVERLARCSSEFCAGLLLSWRANV